jgi:hypothetical protein
VLRSIVLGEVFLFQWIDGRDKFNPLYLLFANWLCGRTSHERFKRWVSTPPNPPPMTDAKKVVATERRMDSPPRCDCGDRASSTKTLRSTSCVRTLIM